MFLIASDTLSHPPNPRKKLRGSLSAQRIAIDCVYFHFTHTWFVNWLKVALCFISMKIR